MKVLGCILICLVFYTNAVGIFMEDSGLGKEYLQKYDGTDDQEGFLKAINKYDLSSKINGYLTGILGSDYKKIDLFLGAEKEHKKDNYYQIRGKKKFDNIIRPIEGYMQVVKVSKEVLCTNMLDVDESCHVIYFKYEFRTYNEEADQDVFYGYASMVDIFNKNTKKPKNIWFASECSELMKTFVGNWKDILSGKVDKCIFSIDVCCVYELPYSMEFYYYPDDEDGGIPGINPRYDDPEWHSIQLPSWAD